MVRNERRQPALSRSRDRATAASAAALEALRRSRGLALSQQADILQFLQQAAQWGDSGSVLPKLTELTAKAMQAQRVGFWRYGADAGKLVCADLYDDPAKTHRCDMERDAAELPLGATLRARREPAADSSRSAVGAGSAYFVDDSVGFAPAAMYLPIVKAAQTIGVLEIVRDADAASSPWTAEERMFGMLVGSLVMLLLEQDAHRRSQAALQQREYQLRVVADSMPALIAYVDAQERVGFHNRAYGAWFGAAAPAAVGRTLAQVLGARVYRGLRGKLRRALAGEEMSFERSRRGHDGTRRTDLIKCVPQLADDGQVLGFHALVIDITEQKRRERDIKDALARAQAAARARDEFLATVSHELRTPLNAIVGFNHLLLEKACSPQERARYLGYARDAGKALLLQVNDLLDMAKIEAGKVELESIGFDLPLLLEATVDMVRAQAQRRGLELRTSIAPEVAQWMRGDPARLRQVLLNLLGNAVKFTARGSVCLSAALDSERRLEIKVADTGIGIAPEKLGRIFDKFFQAEPSTARRYGGTGLGLAISKRLAGLMGGTLSAASVLGSGCTFSLALPLEPVAAPAPAAARRARARAARILVAEDQEANAILAKALLEHLGHAVELAANGVEALEKLQQGSFDLVLMDLTMPLMGGLEAARRIRELASPMRNVIIVALSASVYAADIEDCKLAGMNDHLAKPIEPEALARTLDRWLGAHGEAAAAPQPGVGDEAEGDRLHQLMATIGRRGVANIAAAFTQVLPARLHLFRASPLRRSAIEVEAHNLAGISSTLGLSGLERIARAVVERCRRGDAIDELMPELIASCEAAERRLRSLLADA